MPSSGRRARGDRTPTTIIIDKGHLAFGREQAARAGIALGDWVAIAVAEANNLPIPDYLVESAKRLAAVRAGDEPGQQELPLGA